MLSQILSYWSFFSVLYQADCDAAASMKGGACLLCSKGVLHVANYSRKPRGLPPFINAEWFRLRFSFCCSRCRKRHTPPSRLFQSRRVYIGVTIQLVAYWHQRGIDLKSISRELRIPHQTLYRWIAWWRNEFRRSEFWTIFQSSFSPAQSIPAELIDQLHGTSFLDRLRRWLSLIKCLSVTSANWLRVEPFTQRM